MPTEPSLAALGGGSFARAAKRRLLATRPMFFTASVLPVLLGTAWGHGTAGYLDGQAFVLALVAIMCVHGGVNVLNDVYDEMSGTDAANTARIHPYTGGSRFIQNGVMTLAQMQHWGVTLLGLALIPGVALFALKGVGVVLLGLMGVALGVSYSASPVQLSARGLGQGAVGIGFGILPVTGAAWLQTGTLSMAALLLAVPVSLWVANILLVNEVPDMAADAAAGKRTLPVRIGRGRTRVLYLCLNGLALAAVAGAVVTGILPLVALALPLALFPGAVRAARAIGGAGDRDALTQAIKLTLGIHAAGTLWLAACAWWG